jgi:hypothetical protein
VNKRSIKSTNRYARNMFVSRTITIWHSELTGPLHKLAWMEISNCTCMQKLANKARTTWWSFTKVTNARKPMSTSLPNEYIRNLQYYVHEVAHPERHTSQLRKLVSVNKNENVQYTLECNKKKLYDNKEPVKNVSAKTARSCVAYFIRSGSLKPGEMVNIAWIAETTT